MLPKCCRCSRKVRALLLKAREMGRGGVSESSIKHSRKIRVGGCNSRKHINIGRPFKWAMHPCHPTSTACSKSRGRSRRKQEEGHCLKCFGEAFPEREGPKPTETCSWHCYISIDFCFLWSTCIMYPYTTPAQIGGCKRLYLYTENDRGENVLWAT